MDSIWQQHRTFILKILAGLAVVLVCWIIGASLTEESLADIAARNDSARRTLEKKLVPADADIRDYARSVEKLQEKLRFVAGQVGETRRGEELRLGLIAEILDRLDRNDPALRSEFEGLIRRSPKSCIRRLEQEAREYLINKAGLANVLIDEDLGFGTLELNVADVDRYLLCIALIVDVIDIAVESGVLEVKDIVLGSSGSGRFEEEDTFLREYPVSLEVRGNAGPVLAFLERLNDPAHFIPVKTVRHLTRDKQEREENVVQFELDVMTLVVHPDSELQGRKR